MIEAQAKLKNVHISPKKARLVADAVRGLSVSDALARLPIVYKQAAPIIYKLIKSAAANATDQYDVKPEDLLIKNIIVNKGLDLKRWQPAAFGRAHPFRKHFAHIEVVVMTKEGVTISKKAKKQEVETVKLSEVDKATKGKDAKEINKKEDNKQKTVKGSATESKQAVRIDKKTTNK